MIEYVKTSKDLNTILRDVQMICPKVVSVIILNGLLCFQCDIELEQDEIDWIMRYDPTTLITPPPKPPPEPVIKPNPIQPPSENQEAQNEANDISLKEG